MSNIEHGQDSVGIEELLSSVERPGDYCALGRLFAAMPVVSVDGVGDLSFPVREGQVRALMSVAERAPYGRGPDTVVDTSVRDCWQIDAGKFRLGGSAWPATFAQILEIAAHGLGCPEDRIEARLYKLLVYDEGGFFSGHRDTEKAPRMTATLCISLPTTGSGGDLIVRHGGRETTIDMRAEEPSELAFAAFYADCTHETRRVTSGHRLSVVYNLCLKPGDTRTPRAAPDYSDTAERIAHRLAGRGSAKGTTGSDARGAMLRLLAAAGRAVPAIRFLHEILLVDYDGSENADLPPVLELVGPPDAADFLTALARLALPSYPEQVIAMLRSVCARPLNTEDPLWQSALRKSASALLDALPAAFANEDGDDNVVWPPARRVSLNAGATAELFLLAQQCGLTQEAEAAAAIVVDHPCAVTPDRTLPAALAEMRTHAGMAGSKPFMILWRRAADSLLERSATPPQAPQDWTIAANLPCGCELCERLRTFCEDPTARVARYPLRKDLRKHLHREIDQGRLDLFHQTERRGSPFTLVCTKNRASHERRLVEYREDVACMRSLIESVPDGVSAAEAEAAMERLRKACAAS